MKQLNLSCSLAAVPAALALFAQCASAHPPQPVRPHEPSVGVEFLVAGRPLPTEPSRGGGTFVVVPRWGVEYEIRISNHERRDRVLFVIGVDGLSVMDGSGVSQSSGGYVLDPGETARIRGWRRGNHRVAAFTFTSAGDSYASRTGHHGRIGEVSIWAVREQSPPPPVIVPYRERAPEPMREKAGKMRNRAQRSETGTGYGDELVDHVQPTRFIRSDSMRCLSYRYGLRPVMVEPRPHPGESFTPAPPGWKSRR